MTPPSVTIPDRPWVPAGPKTFGDRLRQIRIDLGRTTNGGLVDVDHVALACGIRPNSWRNWEKGKRPRDMEDVARKISSALNVDLIWLLTGQTSGDFHNEILTFQGGRESCLAA